MTGKYPRLAVRGLLVHQDKLLLVNAWPGKKSDLWCAPGGGVDPGKSLPDNLIREFYEETGLEIAVGAPALVNEFHDPGSDFHQVDIYFHCHTERPEIAKDWVDPEGVVHSRRFVSRTELASLRVKPDSIAEVAWRTGSITYDPLEPIIR